MALHFSGLAYAALGQHKPKKFTTVDVEYTFVRVEAEVVLALRGEDNRVVLDMLMVAWRLDNHVVNIYLDTLSH